ncbi:DUF2931 family protein [Vibrio sp. Hep-1b-8]|uniref:DUF2931 family protein n=1 Tax=Vibrio sp. Hep-1b-8 TaxID=2144187 RepID=UPI001486F0E9|nr:DUF2931 family protein [Vibrio sp. Hep-1b-8]
MNKRYLAITTIAILALITGLVGRTKPNYPDDPRFRPWRIGAAISYNYPASVNEAYGVNYQEDWTSMMLPYGGLLQSRYKMEKYREYTYPDYDGYAIPLGVPVNFTSRQIGTGIKSLPDELYLYWGSHGFRYATVVKVTAQIKAAIVKPYPEYPEEPEGPTCYQTDFMFGLLPDGRAKMWLKGCAYITYIGEYSASKAVPIPPPAPEKELEPLTPEQIEQFGHLLFDTKPKKRPQPPKMYPRPSLDDPIPWDKVNQVWYNPSYKVQNLADVVPSTPE